jgi:signal peptidase I
MASTQQQKTEEKSGAASLLEFFLIIVVALALAFGIQALLVKPFRIPSGSMKPTLTESQRVLVSRVNYHVSDPDRGDIVVFTPPAGAGNDECGVASQPDDGSPCSRPTSGKSGDTFIKRIVALPGDRLKVIAGRVYIDGKRQDEPFISESATCGTCNLRREVTIPPGHFFMMGDNRGESADSREWGPVPEDNLIGQAFFTYWPPRRIGVP